MRKLFLTLFVLLGLSNFSYAQVVTSAYITEDDVTIEQLEQNRIALTNGINSFDGGLTQNASLTTSKLDANANPENRWNEAFNDFVFTGLTIPDTANLSSTTTTGTAYINGVRVVKGATAKTYTASKDTYVDVSDNGVYTYGEVSNGGAEPSVAANSIRIAKVTTDSSQIQESTDRRVTSIIISSGSVPRLTDSDSDTDIFVEKTSDEDIIRFGLGNSTLTASREVLTIQAIDSDDVKLEPITDNDVDLGSLFLEFKDGYFDGTVFIDSMTADSAIISAGHATLLAMTADSSYFPEGTAPSTNLGQGALYTKDTSGQPELFFREESDGDEVQITSAGSIGGTNIDFFPPSSDVFVAFDHGENGVELSSLGVAVTLTSLSLAQLTDCRGNTQCYDFDGSADYVDLADNARYDDWDELTVEAWVYKDTTGIMRYITADLIATLSFRLLVNDTQVEALVGGTTGNLTDTESHGLASNGTGQWIHVVFTLDITTTTAWSSKWYVNGAQVGTTSTFNGGAFDTIDSGFRIGANSTDANFKWDGKISGLRVLSRIMGATEVTDRYNAFKP